MWLLPPFRKPGRRSHGGQSRTQRTRRRCRLEVRTLESRTLMAGGIVQGALFTDLNGNGARDTGEPALAQAGVTIYLDQNQNGLFDAGADPSTLTDSNGAYSFSGLPAGSYTVAQVEPAGLAQTSPAPTPGPGALGDVLRDIPAPVTRPLGSAYVNGSLYVANGSSTVSQIDPTSGTLLSTITVSGSHAIAGLAFDGTNFWAAAGGEIIRFDMAGNVLQSFASPAGNAWGAALDGSSLWVSDSGWPIGSGQIYQLNVGNPQALEPTDGTVLRSFATPEGPVFGLAFDGRHLWAADWDGSQRLYELDQATGTVLRSLPAPRTIQSSGGLYQAGLGYDGQALWVSWYEPGQLPTFPVEMLRVATSGPGQQTVVLDADQAVSGIDFGDFQTGSVSGQVYRDDNNNGVQDAGEPGLEGWRIYLDGNHNGLFDLWEPFTLTDASGSYSFTGLRTGSYSLMADLRQPGWARATPASGGQMTAIVTSGQNVSGVNFGNVQTGVAPVGPAVLVTSTTSPQGFYDSVSGEGQARAVATDAQGNYVVVWAGNGPGDNAGIFARLYNADGTARTGEFRVNAGTANEQHGPVVTMSATGTFAVAWWTADPSLGTNSVVARVFNSTGTPRTADLAVTAASSTQTLVPTGIAMDSTGNFVVLCHGGKRSSSWGFSYGLVIFQRYNSSGQAQGNLTQVVSSNLVNGSSSVGMASDGRFAVTWNEVSSKKGSVVYVQRYSATGKATGSQITTAISFGLPSIAMNGTGSFVVGEKPYSSGSVQGQIFNADGTARSGALAFTIPSGPPTAGIFSESTAESARPGVAMDSNGNVVFTWSDAANIKARRFSSTGVALEDPFLVSEAVGGVRDVPSVSMTGSGNFVVTWSGPGPNGTAGVFAQRFVAPTAPPAGPMAGAALQPSGTATPALAGSLTLAVTPRTASPRLAEGSAAWSTTPLSLHNLGEFDLGLASDQNRLRDMTAEDKVASREIATHDRGGLATPGDPEWQYRIDVLSAWAQERIPALTLEQDPTGGLWDSLAVRDHDFVG